MKQPEREEKLSKIRNEWPADMPAAVGYDAALEVQSEACIAGIHGLGTIIPLIAYIGLIAVMLYINHRFEKNMPQIRAELAARKAK